MDGKIVHNFHVQFLGLIQCPYQILHEDLVNGLGLSIGIQHQRDSSKLLGGKRRSNGIRNIIQLLDGVLYFFFVSSLTLG